MKRKLLLRQRDIALLCDGLTGPPPDDLAQRLARQVRADPLAADVIRDLEAVATDAGLPRESQNRLEAAWDLREDLAHLLDSGDWDDPFEVLDPHGNRPVDLQSLLVLAESRAGRPDPPAGLDAVRTKLTRALEDLESDEELAESFVAKLLERSPRRARAILHLTDALYRRRHGAA